MPATAGVRGDLCGIECLLSATRTGSLRAGFTSLITSPDRLRARAFPRPGHREGSRSLFRAADALRARRPRSRPRWRHRPERGRAGVVLVPPI